MDWENDKTASIFDDLRFGGNLTDSQLLAYSLLRLALAMEGVASGIANVASNMEDYAIYIGGKLDNIASAIGEGKTNEAG